MAMTSLKQGYCAICTKCMSGRAGNDMVSALYKFWSKSLHIIHLTELICWSDSFVPQNRNFYISQAKQSKSSNNEILVGRSCVQEVDKVHQEIEVVMRVTKFYSPLSFLRILLKVNRNCPYCVIQMKSEDFKGFQNSLKMLQFSNVPHTKLFQLKFYKDDIHTFEYKLSHSNTDFR